METKSKFLEHLHARFPRLGDQELGPLVSENLISPFEINLPNSTLEQIRQAILDFDQLRTSSKYIEAHQAELNMNGLIDPGNRAIANSFDFHIDENGNIKLIEMNTNAAFLALGLELYLCKKGVNPVSSFNEESIKQMVLSEIQLHAKAGKKKTPPNADKIRIAIIDEEPASQRLFVEFLVYKNLFEQWGWSVDILDYRQINPVDYDFIYNRFTDFLLSGPESKQIRDAWESQELCLSPHPFEYYLLADKERMTEWARPDYLTQLGFTPDFQERLQKVIPQCSVLTIDNKESLWGEKKKWFFKPLRAYGSKQSYKGASISRKFFDSLEPSETLAQEYVPAPEQIFETPTGPQSFKFDLRCYAYQGELQLVIARIYQGQVTNLKTPLGGFACVNFK